MAVVFMEGFDAYNGVGTGAGLAARWNVGSSRTTMTTGRFTGQSMRLTSSPNSSVHVDWSPAFTGLSQLTIGIAINYNWGTWASPSFYQVVLQGNGVYMIGLRIEGDGSGQIARLTGVAAGTTLFTFPAGTFQQNNWHWMDLELVISDTIGRASMYIDGVFVNEVTGADTNNAGGVITNIGMTDCAQANTSTAILYDDLYVIDSSTRLGERRIDTLRPNADTATKQLTPSTGTANYAMLNSTLVQLTNYVAGATAGLEDLYTFSDLPSLPATIDAVQISAAGSKTDAQTKTIALPVKDGATVYDGADFVLTSTPAILPNTRLMTAKPGGGSWTAADVNALTAGIKITQ